MATTTKKVSIAESLGLIEGNMKRALSASSVVVAAKELKAGIDLMQSTRRAFNATGAAAKSSTKPAPTTKSATPGITDARRKKLLEKSEIGSKVLRDREAKK